MATKLRGAANRRREWMTVPEVLDELAIARRTWQRWRALGRTPKCTRLHNGKLRIERCDFEEWMNSMTEDEEALAR